MKKNNVEHEYRGKSDLFRSSKAKRNRSAKIILWGSISMLLLMIFFLTFGIINISDSISKHINKQPSAQNKTENIMSNNSNAERKQFTLKVDSLLNRPLPTPKATFEHPAFSIPTIEIPLPYVAITFDDGPYAPTTSKVLAALKERNINATFFVIGYRAEINKKLLQNMVEQGHEIGIHSWDHPDYTTLNKTEIKQQQEQCASIVEQYTGEKARISRPPYGGNNSKVDKICGTPIVLWSMDSLDWKETDRRQLIKRVVNETKPGDIILMHDLQKITAECIDEILDGLLAKGYIPVTVSDLIAANHGTTLQKGKIYYDVNNVVKY